MAKQNILISLENEAVDQLAEIKKLRETPAGSKSVEERMKRAKIAIGIIGGYVRLRASISNEHSNQLIERRLNREDISLGISKPKAVIGSGS